MTRICTFFLLSLFLSCKSATVVEDSSAYLDETELFVFYNHFWLNLHHFLYNKASDFKDNSMEELFGNDHWDQFSSSEKEVLNTALSYYQTQLIEEDLRTGDYLYAFKTWVIMQAANQDLPITEEMRQHQTALNEVADIYRKHWWPLHSKAHKQVLEEQLPLIKQLELPAKEKITQLVKAEWQKEKIRVDICSFVKQGRPFTTNRPTHIVMNVGKNAKPAGNWFELLIHEASHHFIFPSSGFIGETINQAANELQMNDPRGLWHAYLFYFTGYVCQELLFEEGIDYTVYMKRRRVFHWYAPYLDKHLPAFIKGEKTLLESSKEIITEFNSRK